MAKRPTTRPDAAASLHPTFQPEGGYLVARYASLTALLAAAADGDSIAPCNHEIWEEAADERGLRSSFKNGYTLSRVIAEMKAPPKCSSSVREMLGTIELREGGKKARQLVRHCDDGDALDAGAWVRRELDGWDRMEKRRPVRRVVRIAVNIGASAGVNPEELWPRGAAAAALSDAIESSGHSVEVTLFTASTSVLENNPSRECVVEAVVKRSDGPLDVDTMALALGEIGFLRTAIFCVRASACGGMKFEESKGRTCRIPASFRDQYDVVIDSDVLSLRAAKGIVDRYAAGFETPGAGE